MLVVTNGQAAVEWLESAWSRRWTAATGEPVGLLAWDDVLHDGPVPGGLSQDALATVRAGFLARAFGSAGRDMEQIRSSLTQRDARLDRALATAEIVVFWFEHDLYDQLQLLQVLVRARSALAGHRLFLVQLDDFVTSSSASALDKAYEARARLTPGTLDEAARLWSAFCSDEPTALVEVVAPGEHRTAGGPLPYVRRGLLRLLAEYPSTLGGLSRTERQILEEAGRPSAAAELFVRCGGREEAAFMGDASFAAHVQRLCEAAEPALAPSDNAMGRSADRGEPFDWRRLLICTPFGRAVLTGESDWVLQNGIDRHVGGVHLTGAPDWRWQDAPSPAIVAYQARSGLPH